MKRTLGIVCTALASAWVLTGCGSLRVIEGPTTPPQWVADPASVSNYNPSAFVYASGISTYTVVLEDGINDARHDAFRKLVERVGVAADDIYRTDRTDKRGTTQTGVPNLPQAIMNSGKAVDIRQSVDARKTRTPQATHVSQTRIHGVDEEQMVYTVWRYRPGLWSRMFGNDTAMRFYDIYVLLRCPIAEFESAVKNEHKWDENAELIRPSLSAEKK